MTRSFRHHPAEPGYRSAAVHRSGRPSRFRGLSVTGEHGLARSGMRPAAILEYGGMMGMEGSISLETGREKLDALGGYL